MRKIILLTILALIFINVSHGAGAFIFNSYTLDKTASPWTSTPVESLLVIRYDDDGSTVVESLYTDAWGYAYANSAFRGDNYERIYCEKSGYTAGDNGWFRFYTTNFDTTADTTGVACRVFAAPGDSTVTITFTLIDIDGTALSGQTVQHYASAPFRGTSNSISANTATGTPYMRKTYTSNSSGVVEITTLKHSSNYIKAGDLFLCSPFVPTANTTLNAIVFKP